MADGRAPRVQAFLDALSAGFADATAARPDDAAFVGRLFAKLAAPAPPGRPPNGAAFEVRPHLGPALDGLRDAAPALRRIGRALAEVEPLMPWTRRRYEGAGAEGFAAGHGNGMIVGPGGIEDRGDVLVGFSLMAPGTRYPDHSHPPDELYLVLSEGEWRQGEADWFTPGLGGTVRNPPGIVHAMRSGPKPLLALWALLDHDAARSN